MNPRLEKSLFRLSRKTLIESFALLHEAALETLWPTRCVLCDIPGTLLCRWASLHNLKQMAATHNFLMENELLDLDKLDAAVESSRKALSEARESLRGIEQSISDKKSLRKVVNDYRRTRPTIDAHKKLSGRKAENYRQSHEAEFIIYEAALRQLKVLAPGKKLPATSKLNTEIEALISEKNAAYNTYRTAKAEYEQLATAKRNAEQILHGTPSRQKKHEQER